MNMKIKSNLGEILIKVKNTQEGLDFFKSYVEANITALTLPIYFSILREE